MFFWLITSILILTSILLVMRNLYRKHEESKIPADISLYQKQLEDVIKESQAGHISAQEAKDSKIEIARRLLLAEKKFTLMQEQAGPILDQKPISKIFIIGLICFISLMSYGIYFLKGFHGAPDWPLAGENAQRMARLAANPEAANLEIIANLQKMVDENPDNPETWQLLARGFMNANQANEAVSAITKANELSPDNADILSEYGEILTLAAGGTVTPQAVGIFLKSIDIEPNDPRPYYYLAEAEWQRGNTERAISIWQDLIKNAQEGAGWAQIVQNRINQAQGKMAETNGVTPNQGDALAGMDDSQKEMIMGMVTGLKSRLETSPDDLEGWNKLIRAYQVLGDIPEQKKAITGLLDYYKRHEAEMTPEDKALEKTYLQWLAEQP